MTEIKYYTKEIINDILDEGKKLRSLDELLEYYKESFDFRAYNIETREYVVLVNKVGDDRIIGKCHLCGIRIKVLKLTDYFDMGERNTIGCFISDKITCPNCGPYLCRFWLPNERKWVLG